MCVCFVLFVWYLPFLSLSISSHDLTINILSRTVIQMFFYSFPDLIPQFELDQSNLSDENKR